MYPRAVTLILNDRCPLRCAHCSAGYSENHLGSALVMDEASVQRVIAALDPAVYQMVVLAGGEPALVPDLVSAAVEACRKIGIWSALTTGPYWGSTPESANRFLDRISTPDFLILSFDKYHLNFIEVKHYKNAADAAIARNIRVALNVCYTSLEEREAATKEIAPFEDRLAGIHYARVMPVRNALGLEDFFAESVQINSLHDLENVPRSCEIGNAQVRLDFELHACCWSGQIPASPLMFSKDITRRPADLRAMDEDRTFQQVLARGVIDSLSDGSKADLLESVRGQRFVNECHLCISMMRQQIFSSIVGGGSKHCNSV